MWSALRHAKEACEGFVRRHKRLMVVAGVTTVCVGGVYYAYQRVVSETEKFTQQLQRQMAEHQRLQLSLSSTTDESHATIQRFLPRLKAKLYEIVNLEAIVQELKILDKTEKAKRNALWEQAKVVAVTRYFTALIAFGVWHLLVFAQVSIIGKRVFEKHREGLPLFQIDKEEQEKVIQAAHHEFLASGLEYFLKDGLQNIKTHVEKIVNSNEQLQQWQVSRKPKVERDELNELLQTIFLSILPSSASLESPELEELTLWRSFLIYPDKRPGQNEHVISLLNDLWDLLESDLFAPALHHSLGFLCGNAFQDLNEVVYGVSEHKQQSRIIEEIEENDDEKKKQKKPSPALAKLIPCLQSEIGKLFTSSPESYLVKYSQGVGEMEAFRNFYEAIFFQQEELIGQLI